MGQGVGLRRAAQRRIPERHDLRRGQQGVGDLDVRSVEDGDPQGHGLQPLHPSRAPDGPLGGPPLGQAVPPGPVGLAARHAAGDDALVLRRVPALVLVDRHDRVGHGRLSRDPAPGALLQVAGGREGLAGRALRRNPGGRPHDASVHVRGARPGHGSALRTDLQEDGLETPRGGRLHRDRHRGRERVVAARGHPLLALHHGLGRSIPGNAIVPRHGLPGAHRGGPARLGSGRQPDRHEVPLAGGGSRWTCFDSSRSPTRGPTSG